MTQSRLRRRHRIGAERGRKNGCEAGGVEGEKGGGALKEGGVEGEGGRALKEAGG
jgi:hypothetical protein